MFVYIYGCSVARAAIRSLQVAAKINHRTSAKAKIRDKVDRIVPLSHKEGSGMEDHGNRKLGGKLYI
jgi:hypothetical protein